MPLIQWPQLHREVTRYWVSVVISAVCVAVGTSIVSLVQGSLEPSTATVFIVYFSAWVVFALTYSVLTWRKLGAADSSTLSRWFSESPLQRRRRRLSETLLGSGGTSAAVTLVAVALVAVIAVVVIPGLRSSPVVIALAVLVVAVSWVLLVFVLAVLYAAEDPGNSRLRFPGTEDFKPVFSDYFYLAVQVTTTFSPSDIVIVSQELRRQITGHCMIAFTYNTVVIALLVSLLMTATR